MIALDGDGTYPNNRVTYRIDDKDPEMKELFHINPDTGVITTKREFQFFNFSILNILLQYMAHYKRFRLDSVSIL